MTKSNKYSVIRRTSYITNLAEGVVSVIALAISYTFIFEEENQDLDAPLGYFFFMIWLFMLLIPNIAFCILGRFSKKDVLFFQILPIIVGAAAYLIFQLFIY